MPLSQPATSNDVILKILSPSFPSQEPVVKTWHHDCSNTSGFQLEENHPSFSIGTGGGWMDAEGLLESDGQSLQVRNITKPQSVEYGHYFGPAFIYNLPDTFPVSGLQNLSVQMEIVNSDPNYAGAASVIMFDENLKPVLGAFCVDQHSIVREQFCWRYYPRNYSHLYTYFGKELWDYDFGTLQDSIGFINSTWSVSYLPGYGINGTLPVANYQGLRTRLFVIDSDVEIMRAIKYLGILIGGYEDSSFPESSIRIHDISLEYELGSVVVDTDPPLLTPQLDISYIYGQTGNTIHWRCDDEHPYRFVLSTIWFYKDFEPNNTEGLWNGSDFIISIDGHKVSSPTGYCTLILQDKAGFIVADSVKVSVYEHPIIIFLRVNAIYIGIISLVGLALAFSIIVIWMDRRKSRDVPLA